MEAKSFCSENNRTLTEKKIEIFMPIPKNMKKERFSFWVRAEYSSTLENLEIMEEYREGIQRQLDQAKKRSKHVFFQVTTMPVFSCFYTLVRKVSWNNNLNKNKYNFRSELHILKKIAELSSAWWPPKFYWAELENPKKLLS